MHPTKEIYMQERNIKVASRRLDIAMAIAGMRTDESLAEAAGITGQTIRNLRSSGTCSFRVLNQLASSLNCNPIDLLVTPGYPDPKLDALAEMSA